MNKRFTNKLWLFLSFLMILYPLYLPFSSQEDMGMFDYIIMGIVFFVQILVIVIFFFIKPKWSDWILKQANKLNVDDSELVETAMSAFLCYVLLIFSSVLPYLLYIDKPMRTFHMVIAFFLSIGIWQDIFSSPLYQVLTNGSNPQKRWRRITPISLIALLGELFFHISPFNATITTCLLAGIFCLEVPFLLCLRAYKNKKSAT